VTDTPKVKVSREEFAEALFYWLSKQLNSKAIKQTAKLFDLKDEEHKDSSETEELFGLNLKNKRDFSRLFEELFALNMWIIVYCCERIFEDVDKRNEFLDIFHRIVYQRLIEVTEENLRQWLLSITAKYIEYNKAAKTQHELGPLWELTSVVNRNLHGELNLDAVLQFQIGIYITESIEALEGAIKKYDIR